MTYFPVTPRDSPPLLAVEAKSRKWYRLPIKVPTPSPKPKDGFWSPTFRLGSFFADRDTMAESKSLSDVSSLPSFEEEAETYLGEDVFDEMSDKDAPVVELEDSAGKEKFASLMSQDSLREALNDPSKFSSLACIWISETDRHFLIVGLAKFGAFLASELGAEQLCFWLVGL
jgi:hypothetical protein